MGGYVSRVSENSPMAKQGSGPQEPTKPGDADRMNLGLERRHTSPSVANHVIHPSDRQASGSGKEELTAEDLKPKATDRKTIDHETQPSHPPADEVEKFMRDPAEIVGDVDLT
jgi:hypothetical protein